MDSFLRPAKTAYITSLRIIGNAIVYPNKSKLPPYLSTTFDRLNLQKENWLNQVQSFGGKDYRLVGSLDRLKEKTRELGRQWLKGIHPIQLLYKPSPQSIHTRVPNADYLILRENG